MHGLGWEEFNFLHNSNNNRKRRERLTVWLDHEPGRLFIRIAVLFCKSIINKLQCELQNVQEANYEYQWIETWNRINKQKEIRL